MNSWLTSGDPRGGKTEGRHGTVGSVLGPFTRMSEHCQQEMGGLGTRCEYARKLMKG